MKQSKDHPTPEENQYCEREAPYTTNERIKTWYTVLIRGEAGNGQILTGLPDPSMETVLYKAVRGPVQGFHQGMALSYLCGRQVTAVWKTASSGIRLEAETI